MLSAKAAIQHSSEQRVLSLTPPCPPPRPSPSTLQVQMCPPQTLVCRARCGVHCPAAKATHTSPLAGEQLSSSIPDRYSCTFWAEASGSSEERPVQALLRNTSGPAAKTYIVDIYLKDLFLYFFLKMLFPMLKECCLQCKAKCF